MSRCVCARGIIWVDSLAFFQAYLIFIEVRESPVAQQLLELWFESLGKLNDGLSCFHLLAWKVESKLRISKASWRSPLIHLFLMRLPWSAFSARELQPPFCVTVALLLITQDTLSGILKQMCFEKAEGCCWSVKTVKNMKIPSGFHLDSI